MVHCVYVFVIYVHFRLLRNAKHWKCDVIVNRCLRLKNQYFFNHDFLHSGKPLLHQERWSIPQAGHSILWFGTWLTRQVTIKTVIS